jgi:TetR/AcrR family transcriptional repressor of nem operon
MTDSGTRHVSGKRERLVEGARRTVHEQGVEKTTIADIAAAADVPVGNVYYYFKTKDELVDAVVERHVCDLRAMLASLERHRTPQARLKALVRALAEQREIVAAHGCPHGSLCSELDKRADRTAAALVQVPVDWATEQFRQLGRRDARDLGVALIAAYHGAALLTNTLRDPDVLAREGRRLERWIDTLA